MTPVELAEQGTPEHDAEAEAAAIRKANEEYQKAYNKAADARDAAFLRATEEFEAALKPAVEKRDRAYDEAHKEYYRWQLEHVEMNDEARDLLRRQLAGEAGPEESLFQSEKFVSDTAKSRDARG